MRTIGTVVSTGVLLLVATGCATSQPSVSPGVAPGPELTTSSSAPPFAPAPPNGGTAVAPDKVDATALPADFPRSVWTQGDGRTVGVVGQEGGCTKSSLEVVEQSTTAVHLGLVETLPLDQQICTMDIRFPPLTASLDGPLGDRKVVLTARQEQK